MEKVRGLIRINKDTEHKLDVLRKHYNKTASDIITDSIKKFLNEDSYREEILNYFFRKYLIKEKYFLNDKERNSTTFSFPVKEYKKIKLELKKLKKNISFNSFVNSLIDKCYYEDYLNEKNLIIDLISDLKDSGFNPNNYFTAQDDNVYIGFNRKILLKKKKKKS